MSNHAQKLEQAKAYLREQGIPSGGRKVVRDVQAQRSGLVEPRKRNFNGASTSNALGDWGVGFFSNNHAIYRNLHLLRRRARDLSMNNDHMKRFVGMVRDNVIGFSGINIQSQADDKIKDVVEAAWLKFGELGNCEVSGKFSFVEMTKLAIRHFAVDGEILAKFVYGRQYKHGFNVQVLDPGQLDELYNVDLSNGNRVRMGVEITPEGRPVGYWLRDADLNDPITMGTTYTRTRVPAEQIIHLFISEGVGQLRGVPPSRTAMIRMKMLDRYEEYELTAAGIESCKSMHYKRDPTAMAQMPLDIAMKEMEDGQERLMEDLEPGVGILPVGWSIESYDPTHPNKNYAGFIKACLRSIASGLEVNYNTLANDLEGVNYSSLRSAALEEREVWKGLQGWFISGFVRPIYQAWLKCAVMSGAIPGASLKDFDALSPTFMQGRRWAWVDPLKDMQAGVLEVSLGVNTRAALIRERGDDPERVFKEWEAERERFGDIIPPEVKGEPKDASSE